jgi:hypothetical protein
MWMYPVAEGHAAQSVPKGISKMARHITRSVNRFTWLAITNEVSVLGLLVFRTLFGRDDTIFNVVATVVVVANVISLIRNRRWLAQERRLLDPPKQEGPAFIMPNELAP